MFSSFPDILPLDSYIVLLVHFICLSLFLEFFFSCISTSIVPSVEILRRFLYNILVPSPFSRLYPRLLLSFSIRVRYCSFFLIVRP
jgi:hypothetical protein